MLTQYDFVEVHLSLVSGQRRIANEEAHKQNNYLEKPYPIYTTTDPEGYKTVSKQNICLCSFICSSKWRRSANGPSSLLDGRQEYGKSFRMHKTNFFERNHLSLSLQSGVLLPKSLPEQIATSEKRI